MQTESHALSSYIIITNLDKQLKRASSQNQEYTTEWTVETITHEFCYCGILQRIRPKFVILH